MTQRLGRRQVLKLGAGAALALPLASACSAEGNPPPPFDEGTCDPAPADGATPMSLDPAAIGQDDGTFSCGVSAGEVSAAGVLLSAFAEDGLPKTLRVWREENGARLLAHESNVTPADGFLKAEVAGLASNTRYAYAFFEPDGNARSEIGSFRTAYDDDCQRALTVGATTCTSTRFAPYASLVELGKHDFDVFCQLGDMTYNDLAVSREEYRAKWKATLQDPGYRAVLPKAASYYTWDDHEFLDSSGIASAPAERIETAKAAFYEALPVKRLGNDKLWRSHRWGKTVEFFVLDCRLERQPETRLTDDAEYISKEQLEWLKGALKASPAHFKVILNSVPMIDWPDEVWLLEGDRWEGYRAQRDGLIAYIANEKISNVWFLSGDFHVGAVARLDRQGPGAKMWEILVGPGANMNPLTLVYDNGNHEDRESIAPVSQFKYFSGLFAGSLLTFDVERDAVRVRYVGVDGTSLFDQWISQRD